ncbi:HD-GYP domain-containing protein, partial [Myxococcota bacterium]|nr:HD-GYP domain-containing protein [Myxococcota bacterium]
HSERVDYFSILIAKELQSNGHAKMIDDEFLYKLDIEAKLHDVGKIAIPDAVLNKAGKLTDEEFLLIKTHPVQSAVIVEPLHDMAESAAVIRHHHERYDGRGYPSGLVGEQIPLRARIIAVADSYDAMTSDRPYRKGMPQEAAIAELVKYTGTQFDPIMTEAFFAALKKLP